MITENLSALKIHKLTQAQYDRELAAGNIDDNALYLTPEEEVYTESEIDNMEFITIGDIDEICSQFVQIDPNQENKFATQDFVKSYVEDYINSALEGDY